MTPETTTAALIEAAGRADWMQVVLNQGPPCFHYEGDRRSFCLRAQRWTGHVDGGEYPEHTFVSLADLLAALSLSASRGDALREALAETIQVIKDRVKYTPERIARWEAVLGVTTTIPGNRTGCRDCGTPYGGDDWIDTRLTREQWRLIAPEDGILCANCIVKRAAKLPNVVSLVARIEFARDVARRAEFLDTQEGADAALAEATGVDSDRLAAEREVFNIVHRGGLDDKTHTGLRGTFTDADLRAAGQDWGAEATDAQPGETTK